MNNAQQLAALNKTTQMALGARNTPSWLRKGADSGPSNPYLAKQKDSASKATGAKPDIASQIPRIRNFGEYRPDKLKGIHIIDVLPVLEKCPKEKYALEMAYLKQ